MENEYGERVVLNDFHGDNRNVYRLNDGELDDDDMMMMMMMLLLTL